MHPKSKRCRRIYKPSFWGLSYLCVFCPWLPDVQEFVVNDAVPVFFLGAILGRCITFFRGSPIEPPRVQHEKPFLDNPRKAHDVYQEWLEEKNIIRLFTPFQALPPPFRKKKKQRSLPYLVLLGQVSSCWMVLASIFSPRCRWGWTCGFQEEGLEVRAFHSWDNGNDR